MSREFYEPDWKILRELSPVALERFCKGVLAEVAQLSSETGKSEHDRYLAVYTLIKRRDKELANAFNDLRRSTALLSLMHMYSHKLLAPDEFARFSPETRASVEGLLRIP